MTDARQDLQPFVAARGLSVSGQSARERQIDPVGKPRLSKELPVEGSGDAQSRWNLNTGRDQPGQAAGLPPGQRGVRTGGKGKNQRTFHR